MTTERAISEVMQIYGYLSPDKQQALDVLIQTIEDLDKMKDVLDKIKRDISAIDTDGNPNAIHTIHKALQIIDKYRGEVYD